MKTLREKGQNNKSLRKLNTTKKKSYNKNENIAKMLNSTDENKAYSEFMKLKNISCSQAKKASSRTTLGNNIVDTFTLVERLHTKGHQKVSFYDFWKNRQKYAKKNYVKNMLDFYKPRKIDEIRKYKYIYNLYFSSIAIFRPLLSMEIYCRVNATRVLDFTMGWGGRLVGACALSLDAYYGVDINTHLQEPYKNMVKLLKKDPQNKTDIQLQFEDALKVDYSKMDYDTVLTSPPYYDLEVYRTTKRSNNYRNHYEWNEEFYKPLIQKTFRHLKKGGNYCLNVPENIYEQGCLPILGKCSSKILMKKGERNLDGKYKEYIYIWKK